MLQQSALSILTVHLHFIALNRIFPSSVKVGKPFNYDLLRPCCLLNGSPYVAGIAKKRGKENRSIFFKKQNPEILN